MVWWHITNEDVVVRTVLPTKTNGLGRCDHVIHTVLGQEDHWILESGDHGPSTEDKQ